MGLSAGSSLGSNPRLADLQRVYDEHLFLDAWKATASFWTPAFDVASLSTEELVFAARLAVRVGGCSVSRNLFWKARKREPASPLVRYFTNHLHVPRSLLLDEMAEFEANSELGGEDRDLQANWIASHAYSWARLRNQVRAAELLRQAHALSPDSAWLHAIEAEVLGFGEDWDASLVSAKRACELDGRSTWALTGHAKALMNLGQMEEAAQLLQCAAADTQSAQLLQTACWYQCAIAEVRDGVDREQAVEAARALAQRIEPLAPLADREFKVGLARTWLDIAQLSGDRAELERWATEARSPFHRQVLANLKQNPMGRRVQLPYRRILQKHLECVPTSVSSALSATGIAISVDELAADVTFGGTAEWAAADWLRNKGLHVRFFSATAEIAARLIEAGIGFVVSWDDDESGHAVAVIGIDHAAGVLLAHDPNSFRGAEYLLRVLDGNRSPLGVLGMAAVSAERAQELDAMLPEEAEVVEAAQAHQKAMTLYGPSAAHAVVTEIAVRFPSHPGTRFLQAIQDLEDGRMGRALASFRELFEHYPNAPSVRLRLMFACRSMGDSALLRQTLKSVVETGAVPGIDAQSDWIQPHPRYVCEYADMLRGSVETNRQAEVLLRSVLNRNFASANAWHVLADLRWVRNEKTTALLGYSIAAFLAAHDEHYARAYVEVLAQCQRTEEGLQWLEDRVRRMGTSIQGISTWITWIGVLEEQGYPARAVAACEAALKQHGDATALLAFTVPFLARMGQWEQAKERLEVLEAGAAKGAFLAAAVAFYRMRGETETALEHAEAWVVEVPRSMQARYALLGLIGAFEGQAAAAARATEWVRAYPANEDFEQALCQQDGGSLNWRKFRVLRRRVERNREDGWAWRELLFKAISAFEQGTAKRLRGRVEQYLAEADRLAPSDPSTIRAHGMWKEANGDWRGAIELYLDAIRHEPDHFWAYRRAWELSARMTDSERRGLWESIESVYLTNVCHLPASLEMMRLLVGGFGARDAERIVAEWRRGRPDDPNVLEAAVDLLLDHGHGRSDAARALELLRPAVERFPYQSGLRFSLAMACRATGDLEGARQVFEELVRRQPDNMAALIQLAWIQQREGAVDGALETLDGASRQWPQDPTPIDARAQILIAESRYDEARTVVEEGLKRLPDSVRMVERAIALFFDCARPEQAVEAARQGVKAFPFGAYLWLLLGKTLKNAPQFAAPGEIEACLRKSLRLNRGLYEAADWMSVLLAEQHRFLEAASLLSGLETELPDPSPVRGRVAWIKWQSGDKKQAVLDLAAVLRNAPGYAWGWNLLLEWLEENQYWELCRELFETVPAQMLTDLGFRQKRRSLLDRNKADLSASSAEWDELLADFPEEVSLHLERFDLLRGAGKAAEAAVVLRRVLPIGEDNVYLLARLVGVKCAEKKFTEAMEHALDVCFAGAEQSPWPVNRVWAEMKSVGMERQLSERLFAKFQEGGHPTRRALVQYAEHILGQQGSKRVPKWIRHSALNFATRQIGKLMRLVEKSGWIEGSTIADLFSQLNKNGYSELALACWNRMRANGLESNTDTWAQAGRALVNLRKHKAARELMRDWRTRKGVGMWVLTNYIACCSRFRRDQLNEVINTCRDALALLPHDHCARFMAYMEAEALVLAGDKHGLMTAWIKYSRFFEGMPDKSEFFPQGQRYLIHELPDAVQFHKDGKNLSYSMLLWKLRWRRLWSQKLRVNGRRIFVLLLRVAVALWLAEMALAPLFK